MADGFLGRWSQRKQAVREGKPLEEPVAVKPVLLVEPTTAPAPALSPDAEPAAIPATPEPLPLPTLEDVRQLTAQSDFAPFVARGVAPEVRNAAMKKLFTDPHYNVMDRLDIYIDDYSQPDPLPLSMLRQMASAQFLNLFEDEKVASPDQPTPTPATEPAIDHDDPDLRLQPNHATGPQEPGRGTE
ncbi:MAG: DUF3306 domain-containing protein [Rhodoferax sp.]|uniref:DUF3306 domain-containing protein n=1 Tax=Rhodoferax sp. TaxID=50421 RepID=UPI00301809E5